MKSVHTVEEYNFDIGTLVSTNSGGPRRYGIVISNTFREPDPRMVKVSWLWRPDAPFSFEKKPYSCFMYKNFLEVVY